jgi:hypothetical protein
MSAASAALAFRPPVPLFREGQAFWEELMRETQEHAQSVNAAAQEHGLDAAHWVEWESGRNMFGIVRKMYPSTEITVSLSFERWGPLIQVLITGYQHEDLRYYPEEQEVPIARDLDGRTVAVLGEGRSYSPSEFASYLVQHLRRCFPDMALPYAAAAYA